MPMGIETQPGPDGTLFTHRVTAHAGGPPSGVFTDSILDLERQAEGTTYPIVSAWETENGGWGIEVMVINERPAPSDDDKAALEGTLAEVLFSIRNP
jgi:hypothetical protein